MYIFCISGFFEINGKYEKLEKMIIKASSGPHALSIICQQLTERHYKKTGHWIHANAIVGEKMHIKKLGFFLMDKISSAPADITIDFLIRYRSKFTRDNLMEIVRLTERVNRRAYYWAEHEFLRRYGMNMSKN